MNIVKCCKFGVNKLFQKYYSVVSKTQVSAQLAALEEQCILVDEKDIVQGRASKKDCHIIRPDGNILLHRAFSVFLFNSKNQLLLQKRSPQKITFPDCFTNSCCSHPLYDFPDELDETEAMGIRRAAQRRLQHELGIPPEEAQIEDLKYMSRIHYRSNHEDGMWGEHEIDYILFLHKDVTLLPNAEEVSETFYLDREQLDKFVNSSVQLSPWFRLIASHNLQLWWDNLHDLNNLVDHSKIHKLN